MYRRIAKTSRTYIKMSTFQIRVIFEILLNSIVCFLQFSSGYIQISVIIKVDLFSGFYGIFSSGYFFKISYVMKDYHKILTEDYKFSTWVSYAFFTSVTILVGGLLGLVSHKIRVINFFP